MVVVVNLFNPEWDQEKKEEYYLIFYGERDALNPGDSVVLHVPKESELYKFVEYCVPCMVRDAVKNRIRNAHICESLEGFYHYMDNY